MSEKTTPQGTAFLGLEWRDGRIDVGVTLVGGDAHLTVELMFPSVKEQQSLSSVTETLLKTPPRGKGDRRADGAAALHALMKMELKSGAKGFVSVEWDGDDPAVCLYLQVPEPPGVKPGVRGKIELPALIARDVRAAGVKKVFAVVITDEDYRFLGGLCDRIMLNCALNDCRSLFLRLPGHGEGLESGVRRSLKEKRGE